jgi:hypothetical protein
VVYHRKVELPPGYAIADAEPAHLTVLVCVTGAGARRLRSAIEGLGGRLDVPDADMVLAELPDVVTAIDLVLDAVADTDARRAGVHMGKVTANDDAIGGHPGRAATDLADMAEPGEALITGGVLVEMGDEGFERFVTGSMGAAELDGTSYAVYRIGHR